MAAPEYPYTDAACEPVTLNGFAPIDNLAKPNWKGQHDAQK